MAGRGLLAKIMRSPELMAALGIGGAGVMTSGEDENEIARGIAGAAREGILGGNFKRVLTDIWTAP